MLPLCTHTLRTCSIKGLLVHNGCIFHWLCIEFALVLHKQTFARLGPKYFSCVLKHSVYFLCALFLQCWQSYIRVLQAYTSSTQEFGIFSVYGILFDCSKYTQHIVCDFVYSECQDILTLSVYTINEYTQDTECTCPYCNTQCA